MIHMKLASKVIVFGADHGVEEGGQAVEVTHHLPGHVQGILKGFRCGVELAKGALALTELVKKLEAMTVSK